MKREPSRAPADGQSVGRANRLVWRIKPLPMAKKSASKRTAKKSVSAKPTGIGRSAISGRFMSVSAAKAHKKTAIVEGAGKKK